MDIFLFYLQYVPKNETMFYSSPSDKSLLCSSLQDAIADDSLTFKHIQYCFPFIYH